MQAAQEEKIMTFEEWTNQIKEIPIEDICDLAEVPHSGRDILCPEHNDRHFGSCKINSNNRYYCFACHASGDSIRLIQTKLGMSWIEAAKYIAMHFNIPDFNECQSYTPMPLTKNQTELLGLNPRQGRAIWAAGASGTKPIRGFSKPIGAEYIVGSSLSVSLNSLYRENREGFWYVITGKLSGIVPVLIALYELEAWKWPVFARTDTQDVLEWALGECQKICLAAKREGVPIPNYQWPAQKKHQAKYKMIL
jgi:hypothetical protein